MEQSLIKLEEAERLLAECVTIEDALPLYNDSDAWTVIAKKNRLSTEAVNHGAEIKVRTAKWLGQRLSEVPKNKGNAGTLNGRNSSGGSILLPPEDSTPTLADAGLTKKQSSQFQQIASIPQDIFNGFIAESKEKNKEITTAGLLRVAKSLKKEDKTIIPQFNDSAVIDLIHGDMLTALPQLGLFDLIITDPPYNVTEWEWDKIGPEFIDTTRQWLTIIKQSLKPQYNLFWFCSPQFAADIEMVFRELSLPVQSRIVWHRRNMAMGSHARVKFIDTWEMIFHCGNRPLNFPQEWSDAWFDVQTFAVPQTNFDHDPKYHPTQKPLDLIKRLANFGSYPNDRILDPFAGSGTTGAACPDGRECVLIERNKEYIKVIEARLNVRYRTA